MHCGNCGGQAEEIQGTQEGGRVSCDDPHERSKERVQNLRSTKQGPNHRTKNGTREWPTKPSNAKDTKERAVESHRSRVKQDQGDTRKSSRTATWGQGPNQRRHGHKRITTRPQRYVAHKCRYATDRSQTQEPNFVGYQEIRIDELPRKALQGPASRRKLWRSSERSWSRCNRTCRSHCRETPSSRRARKRRRSCRS